MLGFTARTLGQMNLPEYADVVAASHRIAPFVHRTPVVTSRTLDDQLGASIFFKCENLQKVGAFKARGACNAILTLPDGVAPGGVATHSSGNHGQAVAYAAAIRGIPAWVVMPDHAPAVKVDAVRGYGAEVVSCRQQDREAVCLDVATEHGASIIHPYDNSVVIAGQGTAALELAEDVPNLDLIIAPVGGGGLLSGTALVGMEFGIRVIGGEPKAVDDAFRSLLTGVRQPAVAAPQTWADGLLTGLGERNFAILSQSGVEIVTVKEDEIVDAARFHMERMKLVVEPSGAVPLAALRSLDVTGQRVGVIISGGNTDLKWHQ